MIDPVLNSSMGGSMKAIQMAVSQGFLHHISGVVPANKVLLLIHKFDERFDLQMTTGKRDHARRQGKATFKLFLWPLHESTSFAWWLLRTDGEHPLLAMETWIDARSDQRIQWPWLYELVRLTVPPKLRARYKRKNGKVAIRPETWTWRIRPKEVERIKAYVRHIVHMRDGRLQQLLRSLMRAPGFRGVRDDVFQLLRYIEKRCEKHDRDDVVVPAKIYPMRSKVGSPVPLSTVLKRVRAGRESWFPASAKETAPKPDPSLLIQVDTVQVHLTKEQPDAAA